jgi:hypothetical protein
MNTEMWVALLSASATVAAAIIGYVAGSAKTRWDLQAKYDANLQAKRLEVYQSLWRCLAPLALAEPSGDRDDGKVSSLAQSLTDWYYNEGGLLLSGTESPGVPGAGVRPALCIPLEPDEIPPTHSYEGGIFPSFMDLNSDVQRAARRKRGVGSKEFDCLRDKGSNLRTALSEDVRSRRILA